MDSVLLGLFCLWFVCVGVTVSSVETNITMGLFVWMDGQHQQDNITTFDEFGQAWSQCDSNNDSYLSEEEVKEMLQQLQLEPNSSAVYQFWGMDLKNNTILLEIFDDYDRNTDGNITWPEFNRTYMEFVQDYVPESSGGENGSHELYFNDDDE